MGSTLTFRLSDTDREKLRRKAADLGKTESEFIREILQRELDDRPLGKRAAHLIGALELPKDTSDGQVQNIRKQNWRR